jgi:hypothetical protein
VPGAPHLHDGEPVVNADAITSELNRSDLNQPGDRAQLPPP